ncbi:endonuclease [Aquimarina sp. 2201CG5-10]|uniref:endonuclease n=1 Tax=Aquimarina callyspongiae TaxID=3098150 RepID=UPI002AB3B3A4|nr:endonuclease [Aquimarina sp. 2201CG5-10]MDY8138241.1 endonuclease [Aquimarina sp. 2201CG5-10]
MNKYYLLFIVSLTVYFSHGQVVINELDVDTPSTDDMEFIELKSDTPNFSLNGYVLVFFNGSTSGADSSYLAFDLDGYTTDVNGIFLIGGNNVSPVPEFVIFENAIQNGADAVAIYLGNDSDFPDGTLATTSNLVDALVYDTNDADDTVLLGLLGETEQINEGQNGNQTTESIQRNNDGSYTVTTPTPGVLNDGSGVLFNGVSYMLTGSQYNEGDSIDIVFNTQNNVTSDLNFNVSLANGTFDNSDYTGSLSVTIPTGTNTDTITVLITDDNDDEGDEVMKIVFGALPSGFNRLNDNEEIRIVDNDFTTASWGTPLNPTFGNVANTAPADYYDTLNGLADAALVQAVQNVIADPNSVRTQTYSDIIDILKEADQSPLNSNQVWLLYTEQQRPKLDFQTSGGSNVGKWNREHTYPRSRGGFNSIDADDIADGINVFVTTNADSLRHANSDAHGLRATDGPENSSRGNQDYGEYSGPTGNQGSWQGDVARGIFFLAIRYNGLDVVNGDPSNSTVGELGDLATLLDWHRNDPPDDYEMNRNNIIYTWQRNRNPFIDQPDLAEYIWGNNQGETWANTLSIGDNQNDERFLIYPNPAENYVTISAPGKKGKINIYNALGVLVFKSSFQEMERVNVDFSSGIYMVQIVSDERVVNRRLFVK